MTDNTTSIDKATRDRANKKAWKANNRKKVSESDRRYRKANSEKVKAANKRWYESNKERAAANSAAWAKANPDKVRSRVERHSRRPKQIARSLLGAARRRAAEYQIGFTLTAEWIVQKIEQGNCPVTGHRFSLEPRSPWRPSIDRIEPSRGYTPDNCQVVCCIYNFAKHNYRHSDVLELARSLVSMEGCE